MKSCEVSFEWCGLEVVAHIVHDPGCWTRPNGDPGDPPTIDVEIVDMLLEGKAIPGELFDALCSAYDDKLTEKALEAWEDGAVHDQEMRNEL